MFSIDGDDGIWDRLVAQHRQVIDDAIASCDQVPFQSPNIELVPSQQSPAVNGTETPSISLDRSKIPASLDWGLDIPLGFSTCLQMGDGRDWEPTKSIGENTRPAPMAVGSTFDLIPSEEEVASGEGVDELTEGKMRRFKSVTQAQKFLAASELIYQHTQPL